MRVRAIFLACILAAAFIFGCSQKEETEGKKLDDLDTPSKTIEHLFNAILGDKEIDTTALFSSEIPADLASKYVGKITAGTEVAMYNVTGVKEKDNTANVTVKYFYYEKKAGKDEAELTSKKLKEQHLTLNREDGSWLIRYTGDDFDDRVEERVFYDCLNAVMDATIAQELYFGSSGSYTPVLAELKDIMPLNSERCREFKIRNADKYGFEITATTLNESRCHIIATSDAVIPMKYSECAGGAAE